MSEASMQQTWERYVSAWKAVGETDKRAIVEGALASACTYTDPLVDLVGQDALVGYMLDFHRQIPGGHFVTEWFQTHHGVCVAKWTMRDGAGAVLDDGVSFGRFDDRGRLVSMTGFFETPTEPGA